MAYRDIILATTGLLSYWDMQETSGTTVADSVSNLHGTMQNGVTGGGMALLAEGGSSLEFTLGSGNVTFGNIYNFIDRTPFTIELWMRPRTVTSNFQRVVNKDWFTANNNRGGWNILIANNQAGDVLRFVRHRASNASIVNSPNAIQENTTYHIVATYSGNNMRMYINGVEVANLSSTQNIPNTDAYEMRAGRRSDAASEYFDGFMSHLAIYDRNLSAEEVLEHYTAGTTVPSGETYDEVDDEFVVATSLLGADNLEMVDEGPAIVAAALSGIDIHDVQSEGLLFAVVTTQGEHTVDVFHLSAISVQVPLSGTDIFIPKTEGETFEEALGEQVVLHMSQGIDLLEMLHTGQILVVTAPLFSGITHQIVEVGNPQDVPVYQEADDALAMSELDHPYDIPVWIDGASSSIWNELNEFVFRIAVNSELWSTLHEAEGSLTVSIFTDSAYQMFVEELDELILHTVLSGFDFDLGTSDTGYLFMLSHVSGIEQFDTIETGESYEIYWSADAVDTMTWIEYLQEQEIEASLAGADSLSMGEDTYPTVIYAVIDGIDNRIWYDVLDAVVEQFVTDGVDTAEMWYLNPYTASVVISGIDQPAITDTSGAVQIHVVLDGLDRIPLRVYLRFDDTALVKVEPYAGDIMSSLTYTAHLIQAAPYSGDLEKI